MPRRSRRGSPARRPGGDGLAAPKVRRVGGVVRPPGDKIISHRVLMLAALARGKSALSGLLTCADVQRSARVLRPLDAEITKIPESGVWVSISRLLTPDSRLNFGNP